MLRLGMSTEATAKLRARRLVSRHGRWLVPALFVAQLLVACAFLGDTGSIGGDNASGGTSASVHFATLPPGSALPSGPECAALVRRDSWEPRPENRVANHITGHAMSGLEGASRQANRTLVPRINGKFTGTTDEILQWGACKWGIDENVLRAQAVQESDWDQATVGDNGESFGILQIKATVLAGTYPASRKSTAFNVDYVLARWRVCFEGGFSRHGWLPAEARGDLWGCIGVHFSGDWMDDGARRYITRVKRRLRDADWVSWGYPAKR
jgi:hypothetical protein